MLRTLEIRRRVLRSKRLYEVADLDAYADALPYDGQEEETNTCDEAWGK